MRRATTTGSETPCDPWPDDGNHAVRAKWEGPFRMGAQALALPNERSGGDPACQGPPPPPTDLAPAGLALSNRHADVIES
jgi:hypothetical protein